LIILSFALSLLEQLDSNFPLLPLPLQHQEVATFEALNSDAVQTKLRKSRTIGAVPPCDRNPDEGKMVASEVAEAC